MSSKEEFVKERAVHGHFRTERAKLAAAMWDAYCRADLGNRRSLFEGALKDAMQYGREVMGWSHESTAEAVQVMREACRSVHQNPSY